MDSTSVESQPLIVTKLNTDELINKFYFPEDYKWKSVLNSIVLKD